LDRNFGRTSREEEFNAKQNLGTISALAPGPTKITENLDHAGWWQDLPDEYRLVASSLAFECARYGCSLCEYRQQSKPCCIKIPFLSHREHRSSC